MREAADKDALVPLVVYIAKFERERLVGIISHRGPILKKHELFERVVRANL